METQSRYEVIAKLEETKRKLINERDGLNDKLLKKEDDLKLTEENEKDSINRANRSRDDLERQRKIYGITHNRQMEDIERSYLDKTNEFDKQLESINRSEEDSIKQHDRSIEIQKKDIDNFKQTINDRKQTIIEQMISIDENLERFGKIVKEDRTKKIIS